jgi:Cu(I)/Ag(I) efflux system membrane fusion protein
MNKPTVSSLSKNKAVRIAAAAILVLIVLYIGRRSTAPSSQTASAPDAAAQSWTCAMHPELHLPAPGKCPKCGMDLIPEIGKTEDEGPRILAVTETARKLAKVETAKLERRRAEAQLRLVGKVDFDETQLKTISAYVAGRLTRLFVDYTGIPVRAGDHLVEIYSPELYAAQEEYLLAQKTAGSTTGGMRESAELTAQAAREKLILLGLAEEQLAEIRKAGKPSAALTLRSPIGGIVVKKEATEGAYVEKGTPLYTVANLSRVWVRLDAYEQDLAWLRYRQEVEFKTDAYGDEAFKGWISFIDPVLNEETRTVKIRVLADNADGRLKPNMFVRATVKMHVAGSGQPIAPELAGKWICPMHGQVIKDTAAPCDLCGMALVQAEQLGYAKNDAEAPPLLVPASAALLTGPRAVVYVAVPGREMPTYEARTVELGPRVGEWYVVRSGLKEGEEVVVQGAFKLDASLQIKGKSSMMHPAGGPPETGHAGHTVQVADPHAGHSAGTPDSPKTEAETIRLQSPAEFRAQFDAVLQIYFSVSRALFSDNHQAAVQAAKQLDEVLAKIDMTLLQGETHMAWMKEAAVLQKQTAAIAEAKDIDAQRTAFSLLSESLITASKRFGPVNRAGLYILHCPMAFQDKGANWLSDRKDIQNPYFGAKMPGCGEVTATLQEGE